jgi:LysR family transcriptional regulator, glycine cleavage system transcriptional activator
VHSAPTFAARWLVPRLPDFLSQRPGVELSLFPRRDAQGDSPDDADVWIQYGAEDWGNRWSRKLMAMQLFPVCSPRLLNGPLPLRQPSDVLTRTLLHEDAGREWGRWLSAAGLDARSARSHLYLHDVNLVATAAISDQGIALIDNLIGDSDLLSGRLVRLFDIEIPASGSYFVISRPERMRSALTRAFIDWLVTQFP